MVELRRTVSSIIIKLTRASPKGDRPLTVTTDVREHRLAFPAIITATAVALGTSGAPAALYGLYAQRWHFAPLTTTIIFSVYAAAALVAVLVTGAISDRYGRKPVLLAALVLILVGLVVFMTADGVPALIVARVLHGLGVGATVVAATAALLDLRPDDGARTGRLTGVAFNIGIAVAVIGTGFLADHDRHPLVTPYAIIATIAALVLVVIAALPETHTTERAVRLNIARPRVPLSIRSQFRFSVLGAMASWSVLGVFLSLYPAMASRAVHADHVLFGSAVVALSAIAGATSQLLSGRWDARRAAITGDVGTALFVILAIPAVRSGHGLAIALDAAALGFFFGLAFGSSLRHLTDHIPADHRGEVMSAFYVLAYGAMAVPTILAGWAATHWNLEDAFGPFMVLVALACLVAGLLGLTTGDRRRSDVG